MSISGLLVIVTTEPETKHNYDAEQSCLRLGFLSRGLACARLERFAHL